MSFTSHDAQIRRDTCGDCREGCAEHRAGRIDHADPCAACPRRIWHAWGNCQAAARPTPVAAPVSAWVSAPAPSLARRARVYAARGLLVTAAERHTRRDACAGCAHAQATGHRGLYRCTHRACGCGGGDELRMAMPTTVCKAGNWPARPLQGSGSGGA